jgi:hypothetical protein
MVGTYVLPGMMQSARAGGPKDMPRAPSLRGRIGARRA